MSNAIELKEVIDKLKRWNLLNEKSGNLSIRSSKNDDVFIVTPSGMNYDTITSNDMVEIQVSDGRILNDHRKPSIEKDLHRLIYLARKDVNAIIHIHSTWATAMACARKELPPIMAEVPSVKLCDYACPGSIELAQICVDSLGEEENALIMANHGLLVIGKSLKDAVTTCLNIEEACKVYILSSTIGGAVSFNSEEIKEIKAMLKSHGQ